MKSKLLSTAIAVSLLTAACIGNRGNTDAPAPTTADSASAEPGAPIDARMAAEIALKKAKGVASQQELQQLASYLEGQDG